MRHVLIATFGVLAFVALACAGGDETTAPAAQEPAAAAQPAASASTSTDKMETKPSDSAMASSMDKMAIPGPTALTPTEPGHILTVANQIGANSFIVAGDETPKPGQIATFGVRRDPPAAFDMMMTTIWYDLHQVGSPVWGSGNLVRPCLENVYAVCPALASEWEHNADFTQWTFTIRDGVKWHDGTAFTVEDAKFWFDLAFTGYKSGDKVRRPAWYATKMGKFQQRRDPGRQPASHHPGGTQPPLRGDPEDALLHLRPPPAPGPAQAGRGHNGGGAPGREPDGDRPLHAGRRVRKRGHRTGAQERRLLGEGRPGAPAPLP